MDFTPLRSSPFSSVCSFFYLFTKTLQCHFSKDTSTLLIDVPSSTIFLVPYQNVISLLSVNMVFSSDDKAVIKNDYLEKNWTAYRICKEHPTKNWNSVSVQRLLKRFKEYGTMERRPGSGRPRTVATPENEALVEQLICSQEDKPGTYLSPREIEK